MEIWVQKSLDFRVSVFRATLSEFAKLRAKDDGSIWLNGREVALFYLRTGYDPNCYVSDSSWAARLEIEKSRAIKSPSIAYHLLTNKVFQARFTKMETLTKFLSKEESENLSTTFCKMTELTNWNDPQIKHAKNNSQDFCLKFGSKHYS